MPLHLNTNGIYFNGIKGSVTTDPVLEFVDLPDIETIGETTTIFVNRTK